jgi:hypothetical protein
VGNVVDFNKAHKPQGCKSLILKIYNPKNWWILKNNKKN